MSHLSSDGSEVSSLFSHPITRCSSITTDHADSLLTPLEKTVPIKHEINGPRRMMRNSARIQPTTEESRRLFPVPETAEFDPEPYGPYFSIPVAGAALSNSNNPAVQRNKSTKDLISRFESLERVSSPVSTPTTTPRKRESSLTVKRVSPFTGRRDGDQKPEGRSPLRRSFGNLLAIFGKKPKTSGKESDGLSSAPYKQRAPLAVPKRNTAAECLPALHSGPLVYLSPSSSAAPASLPVWTDCTTTLFSTHVLVTWHTSQGNPHPHAIHLDSCIDVHSLALEELDPAEIALLPTRELKVFELLFKEKPGEKFVASSVHERAGWISAIW